MGGCERVGEHEWCMEGDYLGVEGGIWVLGEWQVDDERQV